MTLNLFDDANASNLVNYIRLSSSNMYKSLEKLSSGFKINSASDGPAMLIISERLRSQIASLNQEIENRVAQVHKYDTASSHLMTYRHQLTELRTLAIGAANEGVNSEAAQEAYALEAQNMVTYYNEAVGSAEYNGAMLFDGSAGSLGDLAALEGIDLSSAETAEASIAVIDEAIAEVDSLQVEIGSTQRYEFQSQIASMRVTSQNLQAAESSIRDTDYAMEFSNFLAQQIKYEAGLAILSHWAMSSNSVLQLLGSR
ncbi:MAG: flagellin [Candidatus Zixiibacteriota bacterium]